MFDKDNPMQNRFKGTINLAHLWSRDKAFLHAYAQVHDIVVCSPDRCYVLWQLTRHLDPSIIIEVGVAKGGTARLMSLVAPEVKMFLFDTFEGVPLNLEGIPTGTYVASFNEVCALLPNAWIFKGLFEKNNDPTYGITYHPPVLVHLDCDLQAPTEHAIETFWPWMTKGDVMVIDDYGINLLGITKVIDKHFDSVLRFSYAQAVVIK